MSKFNDSKWRRDFLLEANGQKSTKELKNIRELYEDMMMHLEMALDEGTSTGGPEWREWDKIDRAINMEFTKLSRFIIKNKKIFK
tara:strand:+ start:1539 stop:1793 length:255 start_codon:yes stop_codon:yes gene_type:complete